MLFPMNVSQQLVKTGRLEFNFNNNSFFKKYEIGYWELFQDINNSTRQPVSGPYKVFRPIYKTSTYEKALKKLYKLKDHV